MRTRLLLLPALLTVCALTDSQAVAIAKAARVAGISTEQDQDIWLISSRQLPNPCGCPDSSWKPEYWRRSGCRWHRSSAEEFHAGFDPQRITCFYVHGNRIEREQAFRGGMIVYRRLACAPGTMRFVIWSWPSKRVHGVLRDARQKAIRADAESYYLADTLAELPDDSTVSLIGYSFGGRIVTGCLHLLAGGQLCGNTLMHESPPAFQPRVALIAPAVSHCSLCPHGRHGLATSKIDHMYSTVNPLDPALKRFHVTSKTSKPRALGYRGVSSRCLGPYAHLVCQHNVSDIVGRSHGFDVHFNSSVINRCLQRYVLWDEIP